MTRSTALADRIAAARARAREDLLARLRACLETAEKAPRVERIAVFGSVARGDFHGLSDLDLAVIGPGVRPGDLDTTALLPLDRPVETLYLDPARDSHMMAEVKRDGLTVWSRSA